MAASFRLSGIMRWCIRVVLVVALFALAVEVINTIHLRNLARALVNNGGSVSVTCGPPASAPNRINEIDLYTSPRSAEAWEIYFGGRMARFLAEPSRFPRSHQD